MAAISKQFLLVEPIAKTPYPPLGLMKISSWLKSKHRKCTVYGTIGTEVPKGLRTPDTIYVTSLFTWDLDVLVKVVNYYADRFPGVRIEIGGIAATLLPDEVHKSTGVHPHVGLMSGAEECAPDYSLSFGRSLDTSITFASRGCPRHCPFCYVNDHEPKFAAREEWPQDINPAFPRIVFWDNNWLASDNFHNDCSIIRSFGKTVDFNQGIDARLYSRDVAKELATIKLSPIRFAFDSAKMESPLMKAVDLARKRSTEEIRVYVLYNFQDTPQELYFRLDLLNRNKVLAFPMEYRRPISAKTRFPSQHWNAALLRGFKLTLLYYYRSGLITDSRRSFHSIYGRTYKQFIDKLYAVYEYDKQLKRGAATRK